MGAWSPDAFGNDDALDWVYGLEGVEDLSLIESALVPVVDAGDEELDAVVASEALAALEVVARLRGQPSLEAFPEVAQDWVLRTRLVPPEALVRRGLAALERIEGSDSELRALWDESDSAPDWLASLADLRRRLQAPAQPLGPALDDVARRVRSLTALEFALPPLPAPAMLEGPMAAHARPQLFARIVAAEALGDAAAVRDGIARLWPMLDWESDAKTLWDLAVRDAKVLAAEGQLDAALAGLEPWRDTAESLGPGTFDMRCLAVCQDGGDYDRAEKLRARLIGAEQGALMQWLDLALLQARSGSAETAAALLDAQAVPFSNPALQPWVNFARGILAVRAGEAEGLALLTPWVEGRIAQAQSGPAVWPFLGIGGGWWALALHQAGRASEAQAVLTAIRPLLLTLENALLVDELKAAGLLEPGVAVPAPPQAASADGSLACEWLGAEIDHGPFVSVAVRGVNARAHLEAYRRAFEGGSGRYPFLIGDAGDLAALKASLQPPADGGVAAPAAACAPDAAGWLRAHLAARALHRPAAGPDGAAQDGAVVGELVGEGGADAWPDNLPVLLDPPSGWLKPLVHIGLVDVAPPVALGR